MPGLTRDGSGTGSIWRLRSRNARRTPRKTDLGIDRFVSVSCPLATFCPARSGEAPRTFGPSLSRVSRLAEIDSGRTDPNVYRLVPSVPGEKESPCGNPHDDGRFDALLRAISRQIPACEASSPKIIDDWAAQADSSPCCNPILRSRQCNC